MHGLSNDFMVIEQLTQNFELSTALIQQWANRHTGIGFDQLLVLGPPASKDIDFTYEIFNSDGSQVGQCGNGARAIARFILDQKLSLKQDNLIATRTNQMIVRVLESGLAQVDMDMPIFTPEQVPCLAEVKIDSNTPLSTVTLSVLGQPITFHPLSVGNPHAVIFCEDLNQIDAHLATALQQHPIFPEGVNVGFTQVIDQSTLKLRVFERGAGETQACGSGATAAAIAAIETKRVTTPSVQVQLLGGELNIFWDRSSLRMTGSAVRIFTGRVLVKHGDA